MKCHVLGSGSQRNGYVLTNGEETLIIEVGCKLLEVKKVLNYNMSSIVGALLTHSHNDHAGYIDSYMKAGITILASEETLVEKKVTKMRYMTKSVVPGKGYKLGNFKLIPFSLTHDVPCLGYLIEHPSIGLAAFITDTAECDYIFPPLNHIFIETNFSEDIMERNIVEGRLSPAMRPRLKRSHLEIESTKEILRAQDLSKVMNILLIHLSAGNSDQARFIAEVSAVTGKPVIAAEKGVTVNFNLNPY